MKLDLVLNLLIHSSLPQSLAESPIQRQIREKRAQKDKLKHSKSKAREERAMKEGRHRKQNLPEIQKQDRQTKKQTDGDAKVTEAQVT